MLRKCRVVMTVRSSAIMARVWLVAGGGEGESRSEGVRVHRREATVGMPGSRLRPDPGAEMARARGSLVPGNTADGRCAVPKVLAAEGRDTVIRGRGMPIANETGRRDGRGRVRRKGGLRLGRRVEPNLAFGGGVTNAQGLPAGIELACR